MAEPGTTEDIVDRIKRREAEGMAGLSEVLARREIERLRAELDAAKADIAMLIQKETEACNG